MAPERLQCSVQFVFLFYALKPQIGWASKRARFYSSLHDSQQVVKGNDLLFQLFLLVILFQTASEVMLGKKAVRAVL